MQHIFYQIQGIPIVTLYSYLSILDQIINSCLYFLLLELQKKQKQKQKV